MLCSAISIWVSNRPSRGNMCECCWFQLSTELFLVAAAAVGVVERMLSQSLPFKGWDISLNHLNHQWNRVVLRCQIVSCSSWGTQLNRFNGPFAAEKSCPVWLPPPLSARQISMEGSEARVRGDKSIKKCRQISQSVSIKAILLIYKPVFPEVKGNWWWDLVGLFCFCPKCIFQIPATSGYTLLYLTRMLLSACFLVNGRCLIEEGESFTWKPQIETSGEKNASFRLNTVKVLSFNM